MGTQLTAVVFDAADPAALAGFWAGALGWSEPVPGADGVWTLRGRSGIDLRFLPADRPKLGKNRVHLDLAGDAAEADRVVGLGASRIDIGQGDVPWTVLADPEGNEFCVLPHVTAVDGALAAICQDATDTPAQAEFWTRLIGWTVTESGEWGVRMRPADGHGPALVMGPPAAPKLGPNRVRLGVSCPEPGVDPEGNEYGPR
ncbi:VOC family protein [Streptacidiphilus monticola]|uniref:VOC family protein n=1 Tax=Streptacidiphilus monticola TaxID=2161674 RepID=A0ABW1GB45_9ACTN